MKVSERLNARMPLSSDVAENAAAGAAGAELQRAAVDRGAAGIGRVSGDGQRARAVFDQRGDCRPFRR